jgi:antitoxin component YwqK of YwqJK toxin-antitoxin module
MNPKFFVTSMFLVLMALQPCVSQEKINQTDEKGLKQGHWIKNYPSGIMMYDGYFKDNHPFGEFRRYYENGIVKSVLVFNEDGSQADASLYYENGNLASKGRYIDQKKEGKWQFFSRDIPGYRISEDIYAGNSRNGLSVKFYPDSAVAEKVNYVNDQKNGEWIQLYKNGKNWITSNYNKGKLNGTYEAWYENGIKEISGKYQNNIKNGLWLIYNTDGSVKYKINYTNGVPDNHQMEIDASNLIDSLEKNQGKVPDPEITGEMQ